MNIHMPGWLRLGDEVLDIVLEEMNVSPAKSRWRIRTLQEKMSSINVKCSTVAYGLNLT